MALTYFHLEFIDHRHELALPGQVLLRSRHPAEAGRGCS
jgi:hypothetical protein